MDLPSTGAVDPVAPLREAGFSPFDARAVIQLVDRFVCGWVIAEQAHPALAGDESAPDFEGQLETLLAGVAVTRAWGAPAAKHRLFQGRLWVFLRNARDSANIAFARADHINELDRRILLLLQSQGDMTLAAVSMANGVDKAQVSRAIKRLSQVGLVQRTGIRSPLKLSASGRHLADRLVRLAELRNRELTFGIADDQLEDLFGVIDILLARAIALYEQERKHAATAAQGRDAEIDFPDHAEHDLEPGARISVDRSRIPPPFIALCSYMMRGGSLGYKRKTGLSNFDAWVLVEVCRDPPVSWPQLVLALYRDQSQAGRTVNRLIEIGLVEAQRQARAPPRLLRSHLRGRAYRCNHQRHGSAAQRIPVPGHPVAPAQQFHGCLRCAFAQRRGAACPRKRRCRKWTGIKGRPSRVQSSKSPFAGS